MTMTESLWSLNLIMIIKQSPDFVKKYKKLISKNSLLQIKIRSKLKLFSLNKNHNSLRLHKIKSNGVDMWSISIDMGLRIMFVYRDYGILLINIGGHDEVY